MNQTLHKLAVALVATVLASAACPSFSQEGAAAAPVSTNVTAQAGQPGVTYTAKGPLRFDVDFTGIYPEKMKELRIVKRGSVVGANVALLVVGLAVGNQTGVAPIATANKENFYGDEITDVPDRRNLASPLLNNLLAALDQRITQVAAEEEGATVSYKEVVTIKPTSWSLLYNELMADQGREDEYILRFGALFSKVIEGEEAGMFRKARATERRCYYASSPRKLAEWTANAYAAVVAEQKLVIESCLNQIAAALPTMLGIDSNSKIRAAKVACTKAMDQCVVQSDKAPEPGEAKKACKVDYKQCITDEVRPLIDMTPIGQCKKTLLACRAVVVEKANAVTPGSKPEKSDLLPCNNEYKACVAATK